MVKVVEYISALHPHHPSSIVLSQTIPWVDILMEAMVAGYIAQMRLSLSLQIVPLIIMRSLENLAQLAEGFVAMNHPPRPSPIVILIKISHEAA